jgi:transcriptional regulator with GAF, ATPase, and Fis domain
MRAHLRSLCDGGETGWAAQVASVLARQGVRLSCDEEPGAADSCILLFEHVDEAVLGEVRGHSRHGLRRVLAIGGAPLTGEAAFALRHAGASDVFSWLDSSDTAAQVAARLGRWAEIDEILASPLVQKNLVGHSAAWLKLLRQVIEVATFTESSVLILGETGVGKELIAQLVHTLDRRREKGDLVILDCTTVVPELAGSEFFGHERGAFTGASAPRDGAFALAHRGTLFLDEVGELSLPLQAQLLRMVQERAYKRVGGNSWQQIDFRLILATNRQLEDEVARGSFRRDFFHRIASWICRVPPLAERSEDIVPLIEHFARELVPGQEPPGIEEPLQRYLVARPYPGNVRELKNLTARMIKRHVGPGPLTVGDLPEDELPPEGALPGWPDDQLACSLRRALAQGVSLREISRITTETSIQLALESEDGSLQKAARRLGVTDRALQMRRANRAARSA